MYDLLVIGGGPAGATCARRAAMEGLDVALIEKYIHPRQKICGGALSPRVSKSLGFDFSKYVEREFDAARVHRPSGKETILTREGFGGQLILREQFDAYLLDKAKEAGVEVIEGVEVTAIEQLRKGIRALCSGDSFKGRLLVGADGANGISMKQLGIRSQWAQEDIALCIQAEVHLDESEVERIASLEGEPKSIALDFYYGLVEWGYGWCFPKRTGLNIGIGCRLDKARFLRDKWTDFRKLLAEQKGISGECSTSTIRRNQNTAHRKTFYVGWRRCGISITNDWRRNLLCHRVRNSCSTDGSRICQYQITNTCH